jgi:hypothetical protein
VCIRGGGILAYRNWRADSAQLQATLVTQQQVISAAQQHEQAREEQLTFTLAQIAVLKQRTRTPEDVLREVTSYLPLPEPLRALPAVTSSSSAPGRHRARQARSLAWRSLVSGQRPNGLGTGGPESSGAATGAEGNLGVANAGSAPAGTSNLEPPGISQLLANGTATTGGVLLPSDDLKPLFDYVQDCRACQVRLTAAQQDLADEHYRAKTLESPNNHPPKRATPQFAKLRD